MTRVNRASYAAVRSACPSVLTFAISSPNALLFTKAVFGSTEAVFWLHQSILIPLTVSVRIRVLLIIIY